MATRRLITDENLRRFGLNVKNTITSSEDSINEKIALVEQTANSAAPKAHAAAERANTAAMEAENVNVSLNDSVISVTNRKGETKTMQLASLSDVGDVVADVKHMSKTMGAYTDRADINLTAMETNKAISTDGAKVTKSGWAIAEFTAEKGNVYLFKPNVIDGSVCIFSEYIQSVETRGIDYTYTYNTDGTVASASATYLGTTHTYTYTYAEDKSCTITDETGTVVNTLPMVYRTKVGTYSPLVSLNADTELPKDGYCRYMSHFKGNSAIKVVVSYKVGVADLTMKVTRDGVLASISTQLGNLSQKEDETRKKMYELHGSYVDFLFCAKGTVKVDNLTIDVEPHKIYRLYPKKYLNFSQGWSTYCPLVWIDMTHWDCSQVVDCSDMFNYAADLKEIDLTGLDFSRVTSFANMFRKTGITKIKGLEALRTSNAENLDNGGDQYDAMFAQCSSLTDDEIGSLKAWDTSKMKRISLFKGDKGISQTHGMELWDTSSVVSLASCFLGCSLTTVNFTKWNTGNVTNLNGFLSFNPLTDVELSGWDVSNVTTMVSFLNNSAFIKNLNLLGWNLCKVKNYSSDIIGNSSSIETLKLGEKFFSSPYVTAVTFGHMRKWTNDSVRLSLVTNLYDRKTNGLPDLTLTLSSQTKAVLSEEDIAAMTAKGYIIA